MCFLSLSSSEGAWSATPYQIAGEGQEQITSITTFTDIRPTDWAYQALKNVVETYGCIAGYSDATFRGGKPITRYEAAALVNACLDRVTEVTDELKRLAGEFQQEMAILKGRTDGLEAKIGELAATNFSTTTRLNGFTTFYLNGVAGTERAQSSARYNVFPDPPPTPGTPLPPPGPSTKDRIDAALGAANLAQGISFQYSQILSFSTSFKGGDMLAVDLYTSNLDPISASLFSATANNTGTYLTRLSFDAPPYDNKVTVGDLSYKFQPINKLNITLQAVSKDISGEFLNSNLPFIAAYPYTQAISRFGRLDPIYYPYLGRKGFSADYQISDNFTVGLGYFGGLSNEPLFGGTYLNSTSGQATVASQAMIAQLSFWPTPKDKTLGFTFTYGKLSLPKGSIFGITSATGTAYADQPFGSVAFLNPKTGNVGLLNNTGTNANTAGLGFGWHVGGNLYFTADASYIQATATTNGQIPQFGVRAGDRAGVFQWNAALALNDLGGTGNVATLLVGNPYRVVSHDSEGFSTQRTAPWHVELSYTYRVTDNISIVPGFYYVFNPEAISSNAPIGVFSLKSFIFF